MSRCRQTFRVWLGLLAAGTLLGCGTSHEVLTGAEAYRLELAAPFGDHMVLQSDVRLNVWGTTVPRARIDVSIAGSTGSTRADGDGNWRVVLTPLPADRPGPHQLEILVDGILRHTVKDVLVGEVWLCAGQSNMDYAVAEHHELEPAIWQDDTFEQIRLRFPDGTWAAATPATIAEFSATGYFFARRLHSELGRPVGVLTVSEPGACILQFLPEVDWQASRATRPLLEHALRQLEAYAGGAAERVENDLVPPGDRWPKRPIGIGDLYAEQLEPLLGLRVAGVAWWQGEHGRTISFGYEALQRRLIRRWRELLDDRRLPFVWVQLPTYATAPPRTDQDMLAGKLGLAEVREAQRQCLDIPVTAMATSLDLFSSDEDIWHPPEKHVFGHRLANAALAVAYDRDTTGSGPLLDTYTIEGFQVKLKFRHTGDGLQRGVGQALHGFMLAGTDQRYHLAAARITDVDTVTVWSPEVAHPVAVRYAWAQNPLANLESGTGLPASPFRTDDWPPFWVRDARE
jgi:sialate O-acetylesterase